MLLVLIVDPAHMAHRSRLGVPPAQACLPALRPGDRQRGHGRRRRVR